MLTVHTNAQDLKFYSYDITLTLCDSRKKGASKKAKASVQVFSRYVILECKGRVGIESGKAQSAILYGALRKLLIHLYFLLFESLQFASCRVNVSCKYFCKFLINSSWKYFTLNSQAGREFFPPRKL